MLVKSKKNKNQFNINFVFFLNKINFFEIFSKKFQITLKKTLRATIADSNTH